MLHNILIHFREVANSNCRLVGKGLHCIPTPESSLGVPAEVWGVPKVKLTHP